MARFRFSERVFFMNKFIVRSFYEKKIAYADYVLADHMLSAIKDNTDETVNKAINHIDEKIPIVVPSYNRYENNIFLNYVREYMINDTWPIYVIVRQSQKKLYEANYGDLKSVTFVAFKDEEIDDIGKTRNKMISYFSKKYDTIFNLDDDSRLMFKANAIRHRDNNIRYSRDTKTNDICKMFAMWQLTHEYLSKEHPNCWITYLYNEAFIFDPKYGTTNSYSVGGLATAAIYDENTM